jgi:hypothetical protein
MTDERSNTEQHWSLTRQNADDHRKNSAEITEVKEGVARLDAAMIGLGDQMRAGFHTMNQSLVIANTPKAPVQWWAIAAVGVSVIVAFTSFFGMQAESAQREDDLRFKHVNETLTHIIDDMSSDNSRERADAREQGRHEADLETLAEQFVHMDERAHFHTKVLNDFMMRSGPSE